MGVTYAFHLWVRRVRHASWHASLVVLVAVMSVFTVVTLMAPSAQAWSRGHDTIVLVHGFNGAGNGSSIGFNCDGNGNDEFGSMIDYLGSFHPINGTLMQWYRQDFRAVKYYNQDNCGRYGDDAPATVNLTDGTTCTTDCENLNAARYTNHCSAYYPDGTNSSQNGTNNESIYHLSCVFAWYLYLNFQHGWNVELVAHSMGGLIVRNAIYQVWKSKATWTMPPSLPNISDVVTFSTPHDGLDGVRRAVAWWQTCQGCTQLNEMASNSGFMNEMRAQAQAPQSGATDWTLIGSDCDAVVPSDTATYMDGGRKSIFFANGSHPCYSHESIVTDESELSDAYIEWCDGCAKSESPAQWNTLSSAPHSLRHMMYALWLPNW